MDLSPWLQMIIARQSPLSGLTVPSNGLLVHHFSPVFNISASGTSIHSVAPGENVQIILSPALPGDLASQPITLSGGGGVGALFDTDLCSCLQPLPNCIKSPWPGSSFCAGLAHGVATTCDLRMLEHSSQPGRATQAGLLRCSAQVWVPRAP